MRPCNNCKIEEKFNNGQSICAAVVASPLDTWIMSFLYSQVRAGLTYLSLHLRIVVGPWTFVTVLGS